jgi:hypothetical protein
MPHPPRLDAAAKAAELNLIKSEGRRTTRAREIGIRQHDRETNRLDAVRECQGNQRYVNTAGGGYRFVSHRDRESASPDWMRDASS